MSSPAKRAENSPAAPVPCFSSSLLRVMAQRADSPPPLFFFNRTPCSTASGGAKPFFVHIDPATFNLNPALLEAAITPNTRAIMPVHLFGLPADMDRILAIARANNLVIIEDAAQAIGSRYCDCLTGTLCGYRRFH